MNLESIMWEEIKPILEEDNQSLGTGTGSVGIVRKISNSISIRKSKKGEGAKGKEIKKGRGFKGRNIKMGKGLKGKKSKKSSKSKKLSKKFKSKK